MLPLEVYLKQTQFVDFENEFGEKLVIFLSFIADEKIEELKEKVNEGESFNT